MNLLEKLKRAKSMLRGGVQHAGMHSLRHLRRDHLGPPSGPAGLTETTFADLYALLESDMCRNHVARECVAC